MGERERTPDELLEENRILLGRLKALEDARRQLGELMERLTAVNRVCERMNSFDLAKVVQIAVAELPALLGVRTISIYLYDYTNNELLLQGHNHPHEIATRISVHLPGKTLMELAIQKREIIHVTDIEEFERQHGLSLSRPFAGSYATKSCVVVPLVVGEEKSRHVTGVINFADKVDGEFFNEVNDLPLIRQVTSFLGVVLRNCRLFAEIQEQARQDALTRLANYRAFHEALQAEVGRARRYRRPLSVIMLDVDDFKRINDEHGHQAGDAILQHLAKLIKKSVRREDLPARYGGDEIVIVLPETDRDGALCVANRMRGLARATPLKLNTKTIPVTLSIGIAEFKPEMTLSEFIHAADAALYDAKHKGKDRIEVAP